MYCVTTFLKWENVDGVLYEAVVFQSGTIKHIEMYGEPCDYCLFLASKSQLTLLRLYCAFNRGLTDDSSGWLPSVRRYDTILLTVLV